MDKKMSFGAKVKESFRKFIVNLKHRPQNIPLVMLVITFLYFALNLTHISDTTAKINGANMGLCGFAVMLLSILSLVCFGNSFPKRKPVNKPMYILMFLMFGVILWADYTYMNTAAAAVLQSQAIGKTIVTEKTIYIANVINTILPTHMLLLGISIALILLLPVYSRLIRKINTSIEVEAGQEIEEIDISGED